MKEKATRSTRRGAAVSGRPGYEDSCPGAGAGPGSTGAEEGAAVIGWGEVDDVIVARGRADLGKGRGGGGALGGAVRRGGRAHARTGCESVSPWR